MNNKYLLIALALSAALCLPWFIRYERKKAPALEAVLVALMVAFASLGRIAFAALPHFKPITAIVTIAGASLGPGSGFMTGALSAFVSDMYYGQGPWTLFQAASWGIIGMLSGCFGEPIRKHLPVMLVFGVLSGAIYSLIMELCTVYTAGEAFSLARYLAYAAAGLPVMAAYIISNVVFLWLIGPPLCRRLARIKKKYLGD